VRPLLYSLLTSRREIWLFMDHVTSYQTVLHSQTLAVGETRLLNHSILTVFSGHLRVSCCPRRAGRGRLHSGHQWTAHGPPQTLGGSTKYQKGQGEQRQRETTFWPSMNSPRTSSNTWRLNKLSSRPGRTSHWCGEGVAQVIWHFLSLNMSRILIYKTLVSATMHACTCCSKLFHWR